MQQICEEDPSDADSTLGSKEKRDHSLRICVHNSLKKYVTKVCYSMRRVPYMTPIVKSPADACKESISTSTLHINHIQYVPSQGFGV